MIKSRVIKRSVVVDGHKTSVSLEDIFWTALKDIAQRETKPMMVLLKEIDASRTVGNFSSAIRIFVLEKFRKRSGDVGQT